MLQRKKSLDSLRNLPTPFLLKLYAIVTTVNQCCVLQADGGVRHILPKGTLSAHKLLSFMNELLQSRLEWNYYS